MPIGKNAIKRVTSGVKSVAPDMERSTVVEIKSAEAPKAEAPKKEEPKTAAPKAQAPRKAVKKTVKATTPPEKSFFERIALGDEMPYYLL